MVGGWCADGGGGDGTIAIERLLGSVLNSLAVGGGQWQCRCNSARVVSMHTDYARQIALAVAVPVLAVGKIRADQQQRQQ